MVVRLLRVLVIGFMTIAVGVGTATHAYAEPSAAELEGMIEAQWRTLEPIIEEYNGVAAELKASRAKAEALQRQLEPLSAQVDAAMGQVKLIAVSAYKSGKVGALNALLSSGSPTEMADSLSRLDVLARNQRNQVSGAAEAHNRYAAEKKALDELIAKQAANEAALAAKKKEIEAKIADLEKLQRQRYGGGGGTGGTGGGNCTSANASGAAATAVAAACAQVGKRYQYGAEGPNEFDCSGLTLYAWQKAGKSLPRTAAQQYSATTRVSKDQLQPGDLIFSYSPISHVMMYIGNGTAVHASRAGVPIGTKNVSNDSAIVGYGRVK